MVKASFSVLLKTRVLCGYGVKFWLSIAETKHFSFSDNPCQTLYLRIISMRGHFLFVLLLFSIWSWHIPWLFNNQVLPSKAPNNPPMVWKSFTAYSNLSYLLRKSRKRLLKNAFCQEQIRCSLRRKILLKLLCTLNKAWFVNTWILDEKNQEFTHLLV